MYTYADGVAALERGEQIDHESPSGSIELRTTTGNLVSTKVAVIHVANGGYAAREVIKLDTISTASASGDTAYELRRVQEEPL